MTAITRGTHPVWNNDGNAKLSPPTETTRGCVPGESSEKFPGFAAAAALMSHNPARDTTRPQPLPTDVKHLYSLPRNDVCQGGGRGNACVRRHSRAGPGQRNFPNCSGHFGKRVGGLRVNATPGASCQCRERGNLMAAPLHRDRPSSQDSVQMNVSAFVGEGAPSTKTGNVASTGLPEGSPFPACGAHAGTLGRSDLRTSPAARWAGGTWFSLHRAAFAATAHLFLYQQNAE